ncbi:hypothetical protein, partial [Pseudomonas atacamensis]|uniref:hypothetical protein n=1 Tax=Pseudomonas atacamensis TaxID=2565368 RepID=UPI001FAB46D9
IAQVQQRARKRAEVEEERHELMVVREHKQGWEQRMGQMFKNEEFGDQATSEASDVYKRQGFVGSVRCV